MRSPTILQILADATRVASSPGLVRDKSLTSLLDLALSKDGLARNF